MSPNAPDWSHFIIQNAPSGVVTLDNQGRITDRVLENLQENAIKYSPPKTMVALRAERNKGEIRFAVQDQGPGIPPEDQPHLFEFFSRGTNVGEEKGFGLGLATVKRIIDAHGGRIWLDSSPVKGATFFLPSQKKGNGPTSKMEATIGSWIKSSMIETVFPHTQDKGRMLNALKEEKDKEKRL